MIELFKDTPWNDWFLIMSKGNPPLAFQFLFINFVFFAIYAYRRIRGKKTRHNNLSYLAHGLMFLANVAILYESELLPIYQTNFVAFWRHVQQII